MTTRIFTSCHGFGVLIDALALKASVKSSIDQISVLISVERILYILSIPSASKKNDLVTR